jgi:hypothetical protein
MQEQWPIKALHNETLDVSYLLVWSLLVWLINNNIMMRGDFHYRALAFYSYTIYFCFDGLNQSKMAILWMSSSEKRFYAFW